MMALSGGGEAVDFGHRKCHGGAPACTGYVAPACSGYVAPPPPPPPVCTGVAGCSGRHHCHGGGLFSKLGHRHGCHGEVACVGAPIVTCYGGAAYGCAGGYAPPPPPVIMKGETPKVMPKPIPPEVPPVKKTSIAAPATIVVSLPADATLTVDGNATRSISALRTLVTPALETGSTYVYTLQVRVNGQTQTQQIQVRGGQTTQAQFSFPQSVASR
jgi:uncharacterized protein (TIGR03000 family)